MRIKIAFLTGLYLFFFSSSFLLSQNNIVPNPGFERLNRTNKTWYYNGKVFTEVSKFWESAIYTSPDLYYPRMNIPSYWKERGFGNVSPHRGLCYAGITCYGCGREKYEIASDKKKPHCREYLQILLAEPLVPGQHYYFEMWVHPLQRGLRINRLGMALSMAKADYLSKPEKLGLSAVVEAEKTLEKSGWQKVAGRFVADAAYEYLLIGNFYPDDSTSVVPPAVERAMGYAYYYIDDVLLKKVPPVLPVPVAKDDLSRIQPEKGKVFRLKHLYFEFDKWDLHPRSYIELNKLVKLMQQYPNMKIQIRGHTDNRGEERYNIYLSRKRAKAVMAYLIEQGVSPRRLSYKAFGESQPAADNSTEKGRSINRRVEFLIVSM